MPQAVICIKVDPEKRLIVRIPVIPSVRGVRTIIGCSKIGHRTILDDVNGEKLICGARLNRVPDKPHKEWRIRGTENTVGIGILFGTLNRAMDGMWHCPVDVAWVEKNIVWCEPGEDAPAAEVRERMGLPHPDEGDAGGEEAQGALLEGQEAEASAPDDGEGGALDLAGDAPA